MQIFFRVCLATTLLTASVLLPTAQPALAAVSFEERALQLINGARAAAGVPPVEASAALAAPAGDAPYQGCGYPVAGRSADMGARNYFSHAILNCNNYGASQMLQAAGVSYSSMAENIAWFGGTEDPVAAAEQLHHSLMQSPLHKANMLNRAYTHVGIGHWRTPTGTYWSGGGVRLPNVFVTTQIFAGGLAAPNGGARYHPLTPSRILDTRRGPAPLGAGATMDVQVTGAGGVPSTGVSAVVLNVAVTSPTASSYLTVFPAADHDRWPPTSTTRRGRPCPTW